MMFCSSLIACSPSIFRVPHRGPHFARSLTTIQMLLQGLFPPKLFAASELVRLAEAEAREFVKKLAGFGRSGLWGRLEFLDFEILGFYGFRLSSGAFTVGGKRLQTWDQPVV